MKAYILRRFFYMVVLLLMVSVFAFIVIQLPPGDFLTQYIARLENQMGTVDRAIVENLRVSMGLNRTPLEQYFRWMGNMLKGNFGRSLNGTGPS